MLFHILDLGIFAHVKAVYAVMLGILLAAVADPASGDNHDIAVIPDEKVVVYRLLNPAFAENYRNMDTFILGSRLNPYINARALFFCNNIYIRCGLPSGHLTVRPNIIGPLRHSVEIRHFFQ